MKAYVLNRSPPLAIFSCFIKRIAIYSQYFHPLNASSNGKTRKGLAIGHHIVLQKDLHLQKIT